MEPKLNNIRRFWTWGTRMEPKLTKTVDKIRHF